MDSLFDLFKYSVGDNKEVRVKMVYEGNLGVIDTLMMHEWVKYGEFVAWLRVSRYAGYYVKANRDRIRMTFTGLVRASPFSVVVRFPEERWIDLDNGNLRPLVDQMLFALDQPDRRIERGSEVSVDASDAKRAFDVAVSTLCARLLSPHVDVSEYGVYCRTSFENSFSLRWAL